MKIGNVFFFFWARMHARCVCEEAWWFCWKHKSIPIPFVFFFFLWSIGFEITVFLSFECNWNHWHWHWCHSLLYMWIMCYFGMFVGVDGLKPIVRIVLWEQPCIQSSTWNTTTWNCFRFVWYEINPKKHQWKVYQVYHPFHDTMAQWRNHPNPPKKLIYKGQFWGS